VFSDPAADTRVAADDAVKGASIMRQSFVWKGAVAMAATLTFLWVAPMFAQTQGMERRNDRRNARQSGRAAKQACKAGDEKTRMECRHEKRAVKNSARPLNSGATAPAPNAAQ
jgi:hypothetical protein